MMVVDFSSRTQPTWLVMLVIITLIVIAFIIRWLPVVGAAAVAIAFLKRLLNDEERGR